MKEMSISADIIRQYYDGQALLCQTKEDFRKAGLMANLKYIGVLYDNDKRIYWDAYVRRYGINNNGGTAVLLLQTVTK
jgi:hypothetical protein